MEKRKPIYTGPDVDDFMYAFPVDETRSIEEWEKIVSEYDEKVRNKKRSRVIWLGRAQGFVAGAIANFLVTFGVYLLK
jgi:hypothetical protein